MNIHACAPCPPPQRRNFADTERQGWPAGRRVGRAKNQVEKEKEKRKKGEKEETKQKAWVYDAFETRVEASARAKRSSAAAASGRECASESALLM